MNKLLTQNTVPRGGTELISGRVEDALKDYPARAGVQIIHSRVDRLEGKKRILVCHDMAEDPMYNHLSGEGWHRFDKIVFVSHWQQSMFFKVRGIPYSHGVVIENAIEPIPNHAKPTAEPINIIYTSTPHRGLSILADVFDEISPHYDVHLKVFSSFDLYGWGDRDMNYQPIFNRLRANKKATYRKSVPNKVIREELKNAHIFALPSIWPETSCLSLIEAMSANCLCVHSSLAALPETAKGLTNMYPYTENLQHHRQMFKDRFVDAIKNYNPLKIETDFVNCSHNLTRFKEKWVALIEEVTNG